MRKFLVGLVLGLVAIPAGVYYYFSSGNAPVATSAAPMPLEKTFARMALHARMEKEMPKSVPITADEAGYVAGAQVYKENCAVCHGVAGTAEDCHCERNVSRPAQADGRHRSDGRSSGRKLLEGGERDSNDGYAGF